ncbi:MULTISPECIES: CBM96 family carbohydrate-binding protein [Niastella]|uniref:DNRLRE domain-containing protein n=1 Tax=Niastella soli TaxID=2821487 RepID=A0ABS3YW03_9BACT|nr:DNRLRE domain-containing protein [Niastella soli]MBO9201702.1 DNRLRE domain-containing protein [Niastella soli]
MKLLHFERLAMAVTFLLLFVFTSTLQAQVTLSATGSGTAYDLIASKGFGNENPDCKHPSFGPHVTQAFDNTLGKYVFVFHSHATADDDRCTNEDRTRMEIKGGDGSNAEMQHTQGQTAYYRWKFKLDAGFIPSSRFTHIFQIKAIDGDAGAPLMTITPRAGNPQKIQIIHSSGEGSGSLGTVKEADLAPFKGNWVEAYVKYKSSDGSAGTFEITLTRVSDGAVLLSYSNSSLDMWREGASYNRPKWGVYRGKDDVLRDEQVRFNDFCISESSASLCPSSIGSNPGNPGSVNLSPQHDAYVRDGSNAGTAFGSTDAANLVTKLAPAGQTGNNRETYLSFDLSAVTGTITGATLKVNGHTQDSRDANIVVGAFAVSTTNWTESALTWNNKPASAASALATATVTDATARYYNWNITSYIQSEKAAGRTKVSFVLKNQQETQGQLLWNSKETGSNAPQLNITTAAARQETTTTIPAIITSGLTSFPNPFRNNSTISFTLDKPAHTNLAVFDITGKQVAVLMNGMLTAGSHNAQFNANHLPSGVYTLKLLYNGKTITRKLLKE